MDKYKMNRYGHRERMRNHYIASGYTGMSESLLLELFLGQIIPQRDVKPIVYELQNRFGNLENIFSASFEELVELKYIGENTALIIVLSKKIMDKSMAQQKSHSLKSTDQRIKHIRMEIRELNEEAIIFLALNNSATICSKLTINGSAQLTPENRNKILSMLLNSNASNCIVIHYMPIIQPIESSIYFFSSVKDMLNRINVRLCDAAVASQSKIILASDTPYSTILQ